jgi:light-regulated signal transduction histidine kinase (bacteriophytochrome)
MIIAISILSVLLITAIFVIFNLLRKVETLETYVEELEMSNQSYDNFYSVLKQHVGNAYSYIRNLDRLGSFESDDETGAVFNEIKAVLDMLNKGI